jgi:CubicO group peptidase (beta-lactamase class C family)
MKKILTLGLASLVAATLPAAGDVPSAAGLLAQKTKGQPKVPDPQWLRRELERVRAKYKLPALGASLVIDGKVVAASVVGHRKLGNPTPARRDDCFQIGSVSKPMTSTLIGALVEAGKLRFNDTLENMFPELVKEMQPAYRKVTIRMLISHTSGLPYTPTKGESPDNFADRKEAIANRYQYVRNALADKPAASPGTKNVYSGGAIIAVSYAERKLKKPYEELMQEYVFRKLGMTTAGKFRMATPPDKLDGLWPHVDKGGRVRPIPPRVFRGLSRLSVGGVCCSITDLGKWAAAHLKGERGHSNLLKAATFKRLHASINPPGAQTTMSFARTGVDWAKGPILWHNGCDGTCFALIHIIPQENYATCVATNYGGKKAAPACNEVNLFLVKHVKALHKTGKPARGR